MGANSLMDEKIFVSISQAGMLSPTGRCHTFDQRADGYVRGEACGVLLLCTDDGLIGVPFTKVCGSAINQDGRSNGLTAPNGPSQVKLIREALAGAGVKGRDVEMLEAHGTGTSLGDPIEVQAVSEALGREREGRRLVMGSAKTNFGHTETAAGVLGVLKAVLCMERETVAQHLHLRRLNEYIGTGVMEGMGCVVPVENVEWKSETKRAGVSSFGFSGTNAHVVVEETKKLRREKNGEEKDGGVVVVRVSGKSEAAMQSLARAYSEWMAEGEGSAAAFGRATVAGRMVMKHVQRVVGATRREMARLLAAGESNASEGDEETARARTEEDSDDNKRNNDVPTYAFERKEFWASSVYERSSPAVLPLKIIRSESAHGSSDVSSIVRTVLGMEPGDVIDVDLPFIDMGFDSISLMELARLLSSSFGREIGPQVLFDNFTVSLLSQTLSSFAVESLPESSSQYHNSHQEATSVSGASCRFSTSWDLDALWSQFLEGSDGVTEIPLSRWKWRDFYADSQGVPGKTVSKWGSFFVGVDQFDAAFFNMTPREATSTDPQARMLLECAWEAIESSSCDPLGLQFARGDVSVHVGMQASDYIIVPSAEQEMFAATGNAVSTAAGRISYFLGIQGKASSIDTACSSSHVALIEGVERVMFFGGLKALCFGVNLIGNVKTFILLSRGGFMSPTGRCRTFDASADGYVRAEGCSGLVVEPARKITGRPLASIGGFAVNQDGRSNGLTAPNGAAQKKLIANALRMGRLSPEDVHVVECHGTGTALGDPIEVSALLEVVGKRKTPLVIASAKSNFGHAEFAAGVLGLLKIVASFKSRKIARHLQMWNLNPFIGRDLLERSKTSVPLETVEAEFKEGSCYSISGFGFSGTNAHVVFALSE